MMCRCSHPIKIYNECFSRSLVINKNVSDLCPFVRHQRVPAAISICVAHIRLTIHARVTLLHVIYSPPVLANMYSWPFFSFALQHKCLRIISCLSLSFSLYIWLYHHINSSWRVKYVGTSMLLLVSNICVWCLLFIYIHLYCIIGRFIALYFDIYSFCAAAVTASVLSFRSFEFRLAGGRVNIVAHATATLDNTEHTHTHTHNLRARRSLHKHLRDQRTKTNNNSMGHHFLWRSAYMSGSTIRFGDNRIRAKASILKRQWHRETVHTQQHQQHQHQQQQQQQQSKKKRR